MTARHPVKYLYELTDDRCGPGTDLALLSVSVYRGVVLRSDLTDKEPRADDMSNYKVVRPGDVVVNRMSAYQGALGLATFSGIVTPEYLVLRPRPEVDPRFLAYLFKSDWFVAEMAARVRGIGSTDQGNVRTPRINPADLGRIVATMPSPHRQGVIANYLDAETARIDALINKKQRMIDLCDERFAERVDMLVWFDANEEADWRALSVVVDIAEGQVDPTSEPYATLPLIAPNHIESRTGRILALETAEAQGAISGKYLCHPGEVIYSKIRPALRKACLVDELCLTSADAYPMRPHRSVLPGFLLYFLLSRRFTDFAVMESERVAMPKINRDALGRIRFPVIPLEVQRRVVLALDRMAASTRQTRDALGRQVELLAEHRQALITAAVTGQLDIPEVVA